MLAGHGASRVILVDRDAAGLVSAAVCAAGAAVKRYRFRRSPILSHQARFWAPLHPGETVRVDIWQENDWIAFEAIALDHSVKVICGGKSVIRL